MHVIRFMGNREARKLVNKEVIKNNRDHNADGNFTNSVGSCFTPVDKLDFDTLKRTMRYLSGIVDFDACLLATAETLPYKKTYGRYADYDSPDLYASRERDELSTESYSLNDFDHWMLLAPMGGIRIIGSLAWEKTAFLACSHGDGICKLYTKHFPDRLIDKLGLNDETTA